MLLHESLLVRLISRVFQTTHFILNNVRKGVFLNRTSYDWIGQKTNIRQLIIAEALKPALVEMARLAEKQRSTDGKEW